MWHKFWYYFKKFWWILLVGVGFIIGFLIKPSKPSAGMKMLKKQQKDLKEEQEELKKEQEHLEREAEEIEEKDYFNDVDSAVDFLNNRLRKHK